MWLGKVVEAEIREASFRMQTGDATGLCTRSQAAYFCCIDSMVLVTESNLTSPKSISEFNFMEDRSHDGKNSKHHDVHRSRDGVPASEILTNR